jgi:hypothetical protein
MASKQDSGSAAGKGGAKPAAKASTADKTTSAKTTSTSAPAKAAAHSPANSSGAATALAEERGKREAAEAALAAERARIATLEAEQRQMAEQLKVLQASVARQSTAPAHERTREKAPELGETAAEAAGTVDSTIGLNPKEANNPSLADGVLELMAHYLGKDRVVAVGEIGYDDQTAAEDKHFAAQLELATKFDLPVLVHTPHRDKKRGTERTIALVREQRFPEERVLIDHNNEETLPLVLETGCWAGHSIYPAPRWTSAGWPRSS